MPRKRALDRAELAEKFKQWANDDGIKASPDLLFQVMDAARRRPAPVVPGAQPCTFADWLYDILPENEVKRLIEEAFHEVRFQPNRIEAFFQQLIRKLAMRQRCTYRFIPPRISSRECFVLLEDSNQQAFDQAWDKGTLSLERLIEFGAVIEFLTKHDDSNRQQLQLLEDLERREFTHAVYEHAIEVLRQVFAWTKQEVIRERERREKRQQNWLREAYGEGLFRRYRS